MFCSCSFWNPTDFVSSHISKLCLKLMHSIRLLTDVVGLTKLRYSCPFPLVHIVTHIHCVKPSHVQCTLIQQLMIYDGRCNLLHAVTMISSLRGTRLPSLHQIAQRKITIDIPKQFPGRASCVWQHFKRFSFLGFECCTTENSFPNYSNRIWSFLFKLRKQEQHMNKELTALPFTRTAIHKSRRIALSLVFLYVLSDFSFCHCKAIKITLGEKRSLYWFLFFFFWK